MALGKRLRFEVFKRDSFTCQYCGKQAPDVVLHVDHLHPRAAGGADDILNLITSCVDCNMGKSDKLLSDNAVVEKKRDQLALLQERKEQIEMMMEWQMALHDIDGQAVDRLADHWCSLVSWVGVNEAGKQDLRKWIKKYSVEEVVSAMYAAHSQYVEFDDADKPTNSSASFGFNKIGGICQTLRQQKEKPYLKELYYIRKIVENRCSYFVKHQATEILDIAFSWGADSQHLAGIARDASSWTAWEEPHARLCY